MPGTARRQAQDAPRDAPFTERVQALYASLPSGERKVADLVLDFPGEIAAYAASEIAGLSGVSKATVTRFFRRLGYESFEEARRSARRAREWGSPLFLARRESEGGGIGDETLRRFAEAEGAILQATFAGLDPATLDRVSEALAGAGRLFFLGFRNSAYAAGYARWQFIQFRAEVHMLTGGAETLAERIADLRDGDILVVVGMRRLVAGVRRYAAAAREQGARVLLLTDPSSGIRPDEADWIITCPVENPHVLDSYAGVMAVLRLMAFETMRKRGPEGRRRLQRVESLHGALGEFE